MKFIKETRFYLFWTNQYPSAMDVKTIQLLLHHQFSFEQMKQYVAFPFTNLDEFASVLFRKTPELKEILSRVVSYEALCEFYLIFDDVRQQFKKLVTAALVYPMMLYLSSLITIMFLYHFFLPQVKSFLQSSQQPDELFVFALYLLYWGLLIGFFCLLILHFNASTSEFRLQIYYQGLSTISFLQLHRISSLLFVIGFQYLIKTGVSTKHSLEVMLQFRKWPLVHQMAYQMLDLLKQGKSLEHSFRQLSKSPLLTQYVMKGDICNDLITAFDEYIQLETKLLLQSYRKSLTHVKLFSYLMVIVTLGVSYRVISIPLQHILTQF